MMAITTSNSMSVKADPSLGRFRFVFTGTDRRRFSLSSHGLSFLGLPRTSRLGRFADHTGVIGPPGFGDLIRAGCSRKRFHKRCQPDSFAFAAESGELAGNRTGREEARARFPMANGTRRRFRGELRHPHGRRAGGRRRASDPEFAWRPDRHCLADFALDSLPSVLGMWHLAHRFCHRATNPWCRGGCIWRRVARVSEEFRLRFFRKRLQGNPA